MCVAAFMAARYRKLLLCQLKAHKCSHYHCCEPRKWLWMVVDKNNSIKQHTQRLDTLGAMTSAICSTLTTRCMQYFDYWAP
jgi:hypothetical protein